MNDCQIQTDNSIDSKESAYDMERLNRRLSTIEGILDQKDESWIEIIKNYDQMSNFDRQSVMINSNRISQIHQESDSKVLYINTGVQTVWEYPNFTQEDIDQLVHKLK